MRSRDPQPTPEALRRRRIGAIHAQATKLGMEEDTRRALQLRVTGHASAKDMTLQQLGDVLSELARLDGRSNDQARSFDVHHGEPKDLVSRPMLRKVQALLAHGKKPWAYAHELAKRMFDVTRVEWLRDDQLHKLIAALEVDKRRAARPKKARL